ncbi:acidic mammalian chitinase-like [Periplaneta americana]|uniref:acidic mammalian chitinase-like n=1 Tax=Periplaneta americana TaxID=6978 RepID=UPI0037E74ECC
MRCWLPLLSVLVVVSSYVDAYRIVCYLESWATYRTGNGKFEVEDIDPHLCTHVIYSFVGISGDGQVTLLDSWNDIDKGAIRRLNDLRSKNSNLKTMAAIGGASASTDTFSKVVNNANLRNTFANNIISFVKKYGFNGFDLDWEYPTNKGAFTELLKILRPKFDQNGLILSAAIGAGLDTIDSAYDVSALGQYLDFINVMSYDYHGSWDSVTGENAPLYAGPSDKSDYQRNLNVDATIKHLISKGAPKQKLNLGMGTYGRSFTLSSASNNGVGAPAKGAGRAGPYTQGSGMLGYNEICEQHKAGIWQQHWNGDQKAVYAISGDQWVGYDNIASIKIKSEYIRNNGLGGAMVWAIDTDDFRNICGDGKYPLISTMKSVLG